MEYQGTWKEIWTQKGAMEGTVADIRVYDGWEKSNDDMQEVAERIKNAIDIRPEHKVLEVGCGAGGLAQYMGENYVGIDFSPTLVKRHIEFFHNSVLVAEANDLPFRECLFDRVFAWGVFFYFPSLEYARKAVGEMIRVLKPGGKIFIGELPLYSHDKKHLMFPKEEVCQNWPGEWKFLEGWSEAYADTRYIVLGGSI